VYFELGISSVSKMMITHVFFALFGAVDFLNAVIVGVEGGG